MKCTNKRVLSAVLILTTALSLLSGCGNSVTQETVSNAYDVFDRSNYSFSSASADASAVSYFSDGLCVGGTENTALDNTHYEVCGGAGLFNVTTGNINYAYNIHAQLYPASTTKILTCYIAVTTGNLDDVVTVSENATNQASDSSTCGLNTGDQITLRDLLYGMMLRSGNDAAIAIAEYLSGSTENFAQLMNETAASLGATQSNFVNPNGLPDENHYTTIYDMYLILNVAMKNETFMEIFTSSGHTASYTTAAGEPASQDWATTNRYLIGEETVPENITILGGKTGTTGEAGYCLTLLIQNGNGDYLISTVYKADCRSNLYLLMNEMMTYYANL